MKLTATKKLKSWWFKRRLPFLLGGSRIHSLGILGGNPLILNHQLGLGWVGCINDATTLLSRTFANVILGMLFFYIRYLPKLPNSNYSTMVGKALYQLKVFWSFKSRVIIWHQPKSALLRKKHPWKLPYLCIHLMPPLRNGKFNDPCILPGDYWRYSPKTWWRLFIVFFEPTQGETYFRSLSIWESFNQPNQFWEG